MITEYPMNWQQFKMHIDQTTDSANWVYRGHASTDWLLESTLYRFFGKKKETFLAKNYYNIIKNVLSDSRIKRHPDFNNLILPERNPFMNNLLYGDEQHYEDFKNVFEVMITLRHLGFPSPLVDWTRNLNVAAFFALSNIEVNDNISIMRIKISSAFDLFELQIINSDFHFSSANSRHEKQESIYTLAIKQGFADTLVAPEKRVGPVLHLKAYDNLNLLNPLIEKYIITDSKEKRLAILNELYNEGFSFERIYGETHLLENTILKDLAIQTILLEKTEIITGL